MAGQGRGNAGDVNHTANITHRNIRRLGGVTRQAQWNLQMQLSAMRCNKLGHVKGKKIIVGAYRHERYMCKRCMRVIGNQDIPEDDPTDTQDAETNAQPVSVPDAAHAVARVEE